MMTQTAPQPRSIDALLEVMRRLRDPVGGCPWDREQTFETIASYTIEEAYEVSDAIERSSMPDLKEELGDLLFQVVFHARLAEEQGLFNFDDVAQGMSEKLIRRHPHVFGEASHRSVEEQTVAWEETKAQERQAKSKTGLLDDVPVGLPALTRAAKLTKRAARVGFDWPDAYAVLDKLDEEVAELKVELAAGDAAKAKGELGDILFVLANLARKLDIEPEDALRLTNTKFVRRFHFIETELAKSGLKPEQATLDDMESLWIQAKTLEHP